MQKVDLIVHLRATNHDGEDMSVDDWMDAMISIFTEVSGDIDLELEVTHIEMG